MVLWVDLHHLRYKQLTYAIVNVKKKVILLKHQETDVV